LTGVDYGGKTFGTWQEAADYRNSLFGDDDD
jgi:hypothetical protein